MLCLLCCVAFHYSGLGKNSVWSCGQTISVFAIYRLSSDIDEHPLRTHGWRKGTIRNFRKGQSLCKALCIALACRHATRGQSLFLETKAFIIWPSTSLGNNHLADRFSPLRHQRLSSGIQSHPFLTPWWSHVIWVAWRCRWTFLALLCLTIIAWQSLGDYQH